MSDKTNYKHSPSKILFNTVGVVLLVLIILLTTGGMVVGGMVASVLKEAPEIDPTTMLSSMNQTSTIYDSNGELLEKVEGVEYRTVVTLDEIPDHLKDAFISIEDERFYTHPGVDIIGIGASVFEQVTSGGSIRGASTITQQLVRNMYLTNERSLARKITEAYLSLEVESILTKDQILEAYLNKIYLGQGAYGVQEAAQTYFDKNVNELTLAESALFAGIVKSTTANQPFRRVEPANYDPETMDSVGTINVLGQDMYLVYNPESVDRQKIVLSQLKKHGKITEEEYQTALNESIKDNLKPGQKTFHNMTSYPVDYIQTQAAELLAKHYDISYEDAQKKVFNDGLQIYSTIDVDMQSDLEEMYDNFTKMIGGSTRAPFFINWRLDNNSNIIDNDGNIIYYRKSNLIDENWNVRLPASNFEFTENGELLLTARALSAHGDNINITDVYTVNSENNLVTHNIGSLLIPSDQYTVVDGGFRVSKEFLDKNPDIFSVSDETGALIISSEFYEHEELGTPQPQSSTVITDYRTGEVKALVGGRGHMKGNRLLNRATESQRQPGSAIKPISVYYPALAEGFTAGSIADDVPIAVNGSQWPRNAYGGYRGLMTFRQNLNISSNAGTVNALEQLGIDKSIEYLTKMNFRSSLVTREDNANYNDENPSALALGGMTRGVTPMQMTAAYGAIANDGIYIEPRVVRQILDNNGNIIVDDNYEKIEITDPGTSYIMKDMLTTVVDTGVTAKPAKLRGMATAGKTGTTQKQADIWFVGFTPYYAIGTWIGNDTPVMTLQQGSVAASRYWNQIATKVHEGLDPISEFEVPDGVDIVTEFISTKSGLLGTRSVSSAGHGTNEIFVDGTQPTEYDDSYTSIRVCSASGKLPTQYCPSSSIVYRSSFKRPVPYDPKDHAGYIPPDMGYGSGVSGYCDVHTKEAYETYQEFLRGPYSNSSSSTNNDDD